MRTILEELWYGNIVPYRACDGATKDMRTLMGYLADHHDALRSTLTDSQKEVLEKFDDCLGELTDLSEREIFAHAFCLGARIAIEVMNFRAE